MEPIRRVEPNLVPDPVFVRRQRPRRAPEATRKEPIPEADFHYFSRVMDALQQDHESIILAQ